MRVVPMGHRSDVSRRPRWWPAKVDGKDTARLVCPNGHFGLLDDHAVAQDGTVSPSVQCPEEGCDFHEEVRLEGWPG